MGNSNRFSRDEAHMGLKTNFEKETEHLSIYKMSSVFPLQFQANNNLTKLVPMLTVIIGEN